MGFSEDERIRHKNEASNRAYEIYKNLRSLKWSHGDIATLAEAEVDKNRSNKVMYEVLKLAIGRTVRTADLDVDLD